LLPLLFLRHSRFFVMAGLVPAIHAFKRCTDETWMPATSAGMTPSF
jgi:hypothetical protein